MSFTQHFLKAPPCSSVGNGYSALLGKLRKVKDGEEEKWLATSVTPLPLQADSLTARWPLAMGQLLLLNVRMAMRRAIVCSQGMNRGLAAI